LRFPIRTIAYIDGFNLYFGSLKGTDYRWLNLEKLVKRICKEQNPKSEVISVKYFTADIKAKLSTRGNNSCIAQQNYLLSLQAHSSNLEIIRGKYNIQPKQYYAHQEPVDFSLKHNVWQAEEKQTDVSIAVHSLCDVIDNECDQVVIFSNDSDLSPALEQIKSRKASIIIGVVAPIRGEGRQPSSDLRKFSDWTRTGIREEELKNSQLPDKVMTRKRTILKPEHW